jgi:hypothetical protein
MTLGPATAPLPSQRQTPEVQLLCACLRWPLAAQDTARIATLSQAPLDWALFTRLVQRHRVAGLVAHALRGPGGAADQPKLAALAANAMQAGWAELRLIETLSGLQGALLAEGIRPLVLKGPAFSIAAYGRLGLRHNRDLDLLIEKAELSAACGVLEAHGYARIEPSAEASRAEVARWEKRQKDMVYQHNGHGTVIELHWRLFDNPHLLPLPHSCESQIVRLTKKFQFETLPIDLHLLFACIHGAHHAWSRLKWLADVAAIFRQMPEADLARFYARSRAMRLHRAVAQALLLCQDLLGVTIPESVRQDAAKDWRIRWLEEAACRALFDSGAAEIEHVRFGSLPKNLTHYLLAGQPRYLISEFLFDLTDMPYAPAVRRLPWLRPIIRIYSWLLHQLRMPAKVK